MAAKGLGSLAGRQNHIRGLVEALQQVAAEERIKAVQLKLFENLKPGDAKKVQ
jgi:uncharacterized membrane protein